MKNRSWKTAIVAILALAGVAFTVAPITAEAGHSSSSSRVSHRCSSCKSPIYQRRSIVGRNHCGDPIYRWVSVSHRCSRSSHGQSSHNSRSSHSSHGHGYSSQGQPHDIISGIVSGIIRSHQSHRSSHFGR